eukprot:SAG11_NODE_5192_length_1634_cov_1.570033_3_plen_86_part_00
MSGADWLKPTAPAREGRRQVADLVRGGAIVREKRANSSDDDVGRGYSAWLMAEARRRKPRLSLLGLMHAGWAAGGRQDPSPEARG